MTTANVQILQYAIRHVFERNYIKHEEFESFAFHLRSAVESLTNSELDRLEIECRRFLAINPYHYHNREHHIAIKRAEEIANEKKIRMLNILAMERERRGERENTQSCVAKVRQ